MRAWSWGLKQVRNKELSLSVLVHMTSLQLLIYTTGCKIIQIIVFQKLKKNDYV